MKAKAEAEKLEQERLLKIKKDEEEKLERKKVCWILQVYVIKFCQVHINIR